MIPDRMKRSSSKGEEFLAVGGSDGTSLAGDATVLALIDTLTKLVNILISNTSTTDATGRQRIILESASGSVLTTLTTLSNLSTLGGTYNTSVIPMDMMNDVWANAIRKNIVTS